MQGTNPKKYRDLVIEKFLEMEGFIDVLITHRYFGSMNNTFFFEVIYDELFNFGLKANILEKIVAKDDIQKVNSLRRLSTIRNNFAHTRFFLIQDADPEDPSKGTVARVPHNKRLSEDIDFDELHEEFEEKYREIYPWLQSLYVSVGGTILNSSQ